MKIINLKGYVGWDITDRYLREQLPDDGSEAYITVDSFGGSVYEGNRLYNTLFDYPGKVTIELGAVAASAASYFPLGVGIKNVGVRKNTTFMGHKAWAFMLGNADELREEADILDGFDRIIATVYSDYTGRQVDDMLIEMGNEIWLIGGQAVIDGGFASFMVDKSIGNNPGEDDSESENDDDLWDKVVDKSVIRARIEEGKNKLRENGVKEDLEKWSACLKGQIVNISTSAPLNAEGNIETEEFENMKLQEFLTKNPEAKAEHEVIIKSAAEASKVAIEQARIEERKLTEDKLNLSGVKLDDDLSNSIKSGEPLDSFMKKEIEARNKELEKPENNQDIGSFATGNQLPAGNKDEKLKSRFDKSLNKRLGKKEKEEGGVNK